MKREFEDENEVDDGNEFEVRIAIAISFETKSYLKMGVFKNGRSFQIIFFLLCCILRLNPPVPSARVKRLR